MSSGIFITSRFMIIREKGHKPEIIVILGFGIYICLNKTFAKI